VTNPDSSKTFCTLCGGLGTIRGPRGYERCEPCNGKGVNKLSMEEIGRNTYTFTLETPPNQGTVRIGAHDALKHASGNTTVPMSSEPKEAKEFDKLKKRYTDPPKGAVHTEPAHEHQSQVLPCKCGAWWDIEIDDWVEATALSDHNRHMSNMVSDQDTSAKSELKEGKHSCSNCKGKSLKYQAMNEMMDEE
jgi:hypothetical protein